MVGRGLDRLSFQYDSIVNGESMKIIKLLLSCTLLIVLFGGCASMNSKSKKAAPLPPGTLNATEVTSLFSGKSVTSVLDENGRVSLTYYNPDGQLSQLRKGKKRNGTWLVKKNGRMCLQFEGRKKRCRIIVKEGLTYSKYIVKRDGNHQRILSYTSFQDGNLVSQ
jgi:hypothetical protein